jgi:AcrR family transcriptional regulator
LGWEKRGKRNDDNANIEKFPLSTSSRANSRDRLGSTTVVKPPRRRRTPPPPERAYHHGDLRRAVLDEALRLIEERGHVDFTLREVARRVGVSHMAPYRHFADKRALLTAITIEAQRMLADRIQAALDASGPELRPRFLAAGWSYVHFALEAPAAFRVMYSGEIDELDPAITATKARSFGILLRFIEEAQRSGAFPHGDPPVLATPIWAMHHGLAILAATGALGEPGSEAVKGAVDDAHGRLLDGLLAGSEACTSGGRAPIMPR